MELIDRFGLLPPQTENLFSAMRVKQRCKALGIEKLEMSHSGGRMVFSSEPKIDPMSIILLIQKEPNRYKFDGKQTLRIIEEFDSSEDRDGFLDALLDKLSLAEAA